MRFGPGTAAKRNAPQRWNLAIRFRWNVGAENKSAAFRQPSIIPLVFRNLRATIRVASVSSNGTFGGDGSGLTNLKGSQFIDGGINREQIALLKWYPAFQSASVAVGTNPQGVAFDGANIWVANGSGNTVSKL